MPTLPNLCFRDATDSWTGIIEVAFNSLREAAWASEVGEEAAVVSHRLWML